MEELIIISHQRESLIEITPKIQTLVKQQGWQTGALVLFCPHTTAGLTLNEAADPDVASDILRFMRGLIPKKGDFKHREGNSDAHLKTSLFGGPGHLLVVENGAIQLGTWQGVFFCDWDGPRQRKLWVQFLPGLTV